MSLKKHLSIRKIFFLLALSFTVFSYSSAYSLEKVRTYSILYVIFSVMLFTIGILKKMVLKLKQMVSIRCSDYSGCCCKAVDMTLGAPPAVLGGKAKFKDCWYGSEEAVIHELIGRKDFVNKVKKDKSALKGKIFVTTLSTGHFMIRWLR